MLRKTFSFSNLRKGLATFRPRPNFDIWRLSGKLLSKVSGDTPVTDSPSVYDPRSLEEAENTSSFCTAASSCGYSLPPSEAAFFWEGSSSEDSKAWTNTGCVCVLGLKLQPAFCDVSPLQPLASCVWTCWLVFVTGHQWQTDSTWMDPSLSAYDLPDSSRLDSPS